MSEEKLPLSLYQSEFRVREDKSWPQDIRVVPEITPGLLILSQMPSHSCLLQKIIFSLRH